MNPNLGAGATKTSVLVLSDSRETADRLLAALADEEDLAVRVAQMAFGEGMKAIARFEPDVVLLTDTIDAPASVVETLDAAAPGVPLVALLPDDDVRSAQACSLAGARATLLHPIQRETLVDAIRQVHQREVRRQQYLTALLDGGVARQQRPRIVAVFGAKGGVGATTLACNLAAALRRLTGRRVALIDCDVLGGDASVQFDVSAARSLADVIPVLRDLESDLVDRLLIETPCGVRLLAAPDQLHRAEAIDGDDVQRVLAALKPYFDYQVVDTASLITPVTLAVLDAADLIVHVVTPEVPALRSAARFLRLAARLDYPTDKVFLVDNRANAGHGITAAMIEEQLQVPVRASLPSSGKSLVECVNSGELLVIAQPRHKVSRAIVDLTHDIAASFGWSARAKAGRSPRDDTPAAVPGGTEAVAPPAGASPSGSNAGASRWRWWPVRRGEQEPRAVPGDRPAPEPPDPDMTPEAAGAPAAPAVPGRAA